MVSASVLLSIQMSFLDFSVASKRAFKTNSFIPQPKLKPLFREVPCAFRQGRKYLPSFRYVGLCSKLVYRDPGLETLNRYNARLNLDMKIRCIRDDFYRDKAFGE